MRPLFLWSWQTAKADQLVILLTDGRTMNLWALDIKASDNYNNETLTCEWFSPWTHVRVYLFNTMILLYEQSDIITAIGCVLISTTLPISPSTACHQWICFFSPIELNNLIRLADGLAVDRKLLCRCHPHISHSESELHALCCWEDLLAINGVVFPRGNTNSPMVLSQTRSNFTNYHWLLLY